MTRPAAVANTVHVSGRIEGYETNVGPKIGGRVDFIAVREGDLVSRGQLIVKISDDDVAAQLRGAQARILKAHEQAEQSAYQVDVIKSQIDEANLRLTQTREDTSAQVQQAAANVAQARAKLSESRASLVQAKAELELAKLRKQRYQLLAQQGAISADENDRVRTTCDTAEAVVTARGQSVQAAQEQLAMANAQLKQARSTRLNPDIRNAQVVALKKQLIQAQYQLKSAQHEIASATADRDQIQANMAYLTIKSPIDGVVTARAVEPGAVVVPGQTLLSVINLNTVYLRGYVPEGQIGKVRVGQSSRVYLDSAPDQALASKVIQIDPEGSFTPENIYFKDDRVKQVFGIKIAINQPDGFAKPGMPADADILVSTTR